MIKGTKEHGGRKFAIPFGVCRDRGLHLKEEREVGGVCEKTVNVKIVWTEIMLKEKRIDKVIGFNLPVNERAKEFERALIGRDILGDFKEREIEYGNC